MKPSIEQWSIVITGQWNPQILNADWVAKNLLSNKESNEIDIQLGITRGLASHVRLVTTDFILLPTRERIQFHPRVPSSDCIAVVEAIALKTLEVLPHTPVTGYGLNFHFEESSDGTFVRGIFDAPDYVELQKMNLKPVQRRATRNLKVDENSLLNLNLTLLDDGRLDVDMNFHNALGPDANLEEFVISMRGSSVRRYAQALKILEQVYNLKLDTESELDD